MYENMFWIFIVENDIFSILNKKMNKFGLFDYFMRRRRRKIELIFVMKSRAQLQEYREYLEQKEVEEQRQASITKLEEEAKRTHHLVTRKAIPRIYNSKYLE